MATTQGRLESIVEVSISTGIGFVVSLLAWPPVAWLHGIEYTYTSNVTITVIFTALSLTRAYIVRRFFARDLHRAAVRIARRLSHVGR